MEWKCAFFPLHERLISSPIDGHSIPNPTFMIQSEFSFWNWLIEFVHIIWSYKFIILNDVKFKAQVNGEKKDERSEICLFGHPTFVKCFVGI